MNSISKYFFKSTLIVLVGLLGSSCNPEYLRPSLPGKIPIVETLPNQNLVAVNSQIQLRGSFYLGEENLMEVGFLVSPISGFVENDQSVEKVIVNKSDLTLTSDGEYLFEMEFNVGLVPELTKYYRAFCKNSVGIGYGNELSFKSVTSIPTVLTITASSVTQNAALLGGNVTSDGGLLVTGRGVAYGKFPNPTLLNSSTIDGVGSGTFTSTLTGLSSSTLYYVRAFATNSLGTSYGNEVVFTTSSACFGAPSVTDIDGNSYETVSIGSQCWMRSNLKVSKYRNGDNIPTGLNSFAWETTTSGAYSMYNSDPVNYDFYGKLYNQYAVTDSRGLCPMGWHVPSDADWTILESHLGGPSEAGALKSTGFWSHPNTVVTNSSGFTALPAGSRLRYNGNIVYISIGNEGFWWSSSLGLIRRLAINNNLIHRDSHQSIFGNSVRCLKD
jgi:uncharacterized protein (TIGR02145 family)